MALPAIAASYAELAERIREQLPNEPHYMLAESFSGPLAVLLSRSPATRCTVLCASFVTPPMPGWVQRLPARWFARPPGAALPFMMTGGDRTLARRVGREIDAVPTDVAVARLRCLATVDVSAELEALQCPVLYLRARRDRLVPARCMRAVRRARSDVHVAEIDGPHLLLQTRPAECWREIRRFAGGCGAT